MSRGASVGLAGLVAGLAASAGPGISLALLAATAILFSLVLWPNRLTACLIGLFGLYYGATIPPIGSSPISAIDLAIIGLVLCAVSSGALQTAVTENFGGLAGASALLLVAGVAAGGVIGATTASSPVSQFQVVLLGSQLVLAYVLGLMCGRAGSWRRAVTIGLQSAALIAAATAILNAMTQLTLGTTVWNEIGLGTRVASLSEVTRSGQFGGARDNLVPTFIALPGLAMFIIRGERRDLAGASMILVASAVSLSRGMWVATLLVVAVALLIRLLPSARQDHRRLSPLGLGAVAVTVVAALFALAAPVVGRFQQSLGSDARDPSRVYRELETRTAAREIATSPRSVILGRGAGYEISRPYVAGSGIRPYPVIENHVLSTWLQFGLLGIVGLIGALFLAGYRSFRLLLRMKLLDADRRDLAAAGITLPILAIAGWFGGTLLLPAVIVPTLICCGLILSQPQS